MPDIVQPVHKEGEVCNVCGSDGGQHFGDCPQHPTNIFMRNKLNQPEPSLLEQRQEYVETLKPPPPKQWLSGSEMKVTEEFMKQAVERITGSPVESVKFKGKSFVVRFL